MIILLKQCNGSLIDFNLFGNKNKQPDPIEGTVITKIETRWDTLKFDSLVYVPKWRVRVDTVHDTTLKYIDTLSILKDYYATYFYSDTLELDSIGNIIINDTISQNSITFREINPNIFIPSKIITRDSLISKNEFYYGIGLTGNQEQFNYIGGELLYRSKRKKVIGAGLGVNQNLQPVVSLRLMWKIGK